MKKFENIVIVTDLDGTFLDDNADPVERNLRAVEYFKANGGYFTVATGRATDHARGAVPYIDKLVNCPAVTCNGACLYDFANAEMPFLSVIKYEDMLRLVSFIRERFPDSGIRASSPDYCFVCEPRDAENKYVSEELKKYPDKNLIAPIEEWRDVTVIKVVLRIDAELLDGAMEMLRAEFDGEFEFTQSWSTIIDIQPCGINKGSTIRKYTRQRLGETAKIYACGDYFNDIEMLKEADVGVCPSNALPQIKSVCGLCLCSNNEGLIADLVEYIEKQQKGDLL